MKLRMILALLLCGLSLNAHAALAKFDVVSATTYVNAIPVGTLMPYAGTSATITTGWVVAAGQSVSRTGIYSDLFAVIGTTYGSADGASFNLPDLRGRGIAGLDNMGGTAANRLTTASGISGTTLGAAGGDQMMQQHGHNLTDPGHVHNASGKYGAAGNNPSGQAVSWNSGNPGNYNTQSATTGITIAVSGTGTAQNVQPTLMLNWIIRYQR